MPFQRSDSVIFSLPFDAAARGENVIKKPRKTQGKSVVKGAMMQAYWLSWIAFPLLFLCLAMMPSAFDGQDNSLAKRHREKAGLWDYRVVASYPHDRNAFTQGLAYDGRFFYEGTGLYGRSTLREVTPASGKIVRMISLSSSYFGEGVTVCGKRLIQLTLKSRTGFVYEKDSFLRTGVFSYSYEGWGITNGNGELIVSDGTDALHFLNPENFREKK
jgi:glutamine cyclotransferase